MLHIALRKNSNFEDLTKYYNLIPCSISYEFDPCDELKAKELTLIESGEEYRKPAGEDLIALAKGLYGKKGKVKF